MQNNYLVVGVARSGIAVVNYLVENNKNVWAFDAKKGLINDLIKNKIIPKSVNSVKKVCKKLALILDCIVISPGIEPEFWQHLGEKYNIPVIGELEFAYNNCNCEIFAITGTNGKTTTTYCVGNIGKSFTSALKNIRDTDNIVCEVSSFQLETINKFKPKVVGFLNIAPDHLDRYKTIDNYINAKKNIFKNLDEQCVAVLNADDKIVSKLGNTHFNCLYFGKKLPPKTNGAYFSKNQIVFVEDGKKVGVVDLKNFKLCGKHNIYNAMCASVMARVCGIDFEVIQKSLEEFTAPSHRLEYVGKLGRIKFYNDSKATNIASCLTALASFKENVFLIMGGSDKGENFAKFFEKVPKCVKHIFVFGATAKKIYHHANLANFENISKFENIEDAFDNAVKKVEEDTVILLSPACASFDQFVNYEQRGDYFKFLVKELMK